MSAHGESTPLVKDRYRSLDSFFDEAAEADTTSQWRFFLHIVLSIGTANASFATAILLISYLLADQEFNSNVMRGDDEAWGGPLAAAVFIGMLPGGIVSGACGDRFGRKPLLLSMLGLNVVTGLWTAFVRGPWELMVVRFLAGVAIGATEPVLFALITELSPPSRRGLCVSLVASFWMVGNLVIAVVGLVVFKILMWSWRWYVILCVMPAVLGVVMVYTLVPESPRFSAVMDRNFDEAIESANQIATLLGRQDQRLLRRNELEHQYPIRTEGIVESRSIVASIRDLYQKEICLGTTIPMQMTWFSICFGSYALVTWINSIWVEINLDDLYWNLVLFALANLPGNLLSFYLVDKAGRIKTLIGSLALSALSLVVFAWYARPGHINTLGVVVSSCTFQALETVAWNDLDTATGEIFPTSSRSTGIGLCTATGRLGAVLAQFASGALIGSPVVLLLISSFSFVVAAAIPPSMLKDGERSKARLVDGYLKPA